MTILLLILFFFFFKQSLSVFEAVSMLTVDSLRDIQPDFHCRYCCFLYFHGKLLQRFRMDYEGKTTKGYGSKRSSVTYQQEGENDVKTESELSQVPLGKDSQFMEA